VKKLVKVNPFDPIEPGLTMESYDDGMVKRKSLGVPVRLMMATQLLAGMAANPEVKNIATWIRTALDCADALIEEHNIDVENQNVKKED
jgi:hypothetical protein